MDDKQSAKLRAYLNLKEVFARHQDTWKALPALSKSYNVFTANVDRINALNTQLQQSSKGSTSSKAQLKEQMANDTMLLVGAMKAYASVNNDTKLAKDVNLGFSTIMNARETDADDLCITAVEKAKAMLPLLADYGSTQADVDAAAASIAKFVELIGKPKSTITQIKNLNEQVAALFKANDKILDEQVDNLLLRFRLSAPGFFSEYFSARRIGGASTGKKEDPTTGQA